MMKLLPILLKCPKWAIAGGIIVASSAVFMIWQGTRHFTASGQRSSAEQPRGQKAEPESMMDIPVSDVVVCGNTLVNFKTGKVIARQWIEGLGDAPPALGGVYAEDKLVLLGTRGMAGAFGFDGLAKPPVKADGQPLGSAAFSRSGDRRVIFVREGNLWEGTIDWLNSMVTGSRKITDVGYFRDDTFRGNWFWNDQMLLVPVLGKTHRVNLETGAVSPDQANIAEITKGANPDGKLTIAALSRNEIAVVDLVKGSLARFPASGGFKQVLWLDHDRAALLLGNKAISVYDHRKGDVVGVFPSNTPMMAMATASPGGECVLVGGNAGAQIFELASGQYVPVKIPMEEGAWVSGKALLCTNSSTDSETRGVWLANSNGEAKRVSNQPADLSRAAGGSPVVAVPGGALFVSGGNLWRFDLASEEVTQVTQGEKLQPTLQLLFQ
jgi:hypothetical protein